MRECKRSISNPDPDLKCKEHLVASHTELKKKLNTIAVPQQKLSSEKRKRKRTHLSCLPILMLANYKTNITSNVINFSLKKIQFPYS